MTIEETLAERGARYGDFQAHAQISQNLQVVVRAYDGWNRCSDVQKESLTLILHKIARIINGDPDYKDNWHDIAGYARLAEDRCGGPE